eukprot:TRINITY_DN60660_c0_g1_i1.p1 TRINITY_DN60660_c0_g1~~TRINITY_DN60660_c0_g1_i1.p1  ORF type:complete len:195 (-),score=44.15 TRINITY_DN60660_c0_g1_i1:43-576(-)
MVESLQRPELGNDAVARMVRLQCRLVGHESDATLQRDFSWARSQAEKHADPELLDVVCHLAELCMQRASLDRYADRKQPLVFVYNCTVGFPKHTAAKIFEAAEDFREEALRPLVGDRTEAIWQVCHSGAWHEQNARDLDSAEGGALTGAFIGFQQDMLKDQGIVLRYAAQMGFDSYE